MNNKTSSALRAVLGSATLPLALFFGLTAIVPSHASGWFIGVVVVCIWVGINADEPAMNWVIFSIVGSTGIAGWITSDWNVAYILSGVIVMCFLPRFVAQASFDDDWPRKEDS